MEFSLPQKNFDDTTIRNQLMNTIHKLINYGNFAHGNNQSTAEKKLPVKDLFSKCDEI